MVLQYGRPDEKGRLAADGYGAELETFYIEMASFGPGKARAFTCYELNREEAKALYSLLGKWLDARTTKGISTS